MTSADASSSKSHSSACHCHARVRSNATPSKKSIRRHASFGVSSCSLAPHSEQFPRSSGNTLLEYLSHHTLLCSLCFIDTHLLFYLHNLVFTKTDEDRPQMPEILGNIGLNYSHSSSSISEAIVFRTISAYLLSCRSIFSTSSSANACASVSSSAFTVR